MDDQERALWEATFKLSSKWRSQQNMWGERIWAIFPGGSLQLLRRPELNMFEEKISPAWLRCSRLREQGKMTSVRYAGARSESCTLLDGSKEKCIFLMVQYESGVKMPVWRSKMTIITTTERKLLEAKSWGGSCKAPRHRRHGPSQGNCSPSPHWRNGQVKRSMVGKELAFDMVTPLRSLTPDYICARLISLFVLPYVVPPSLIPLLEQGRAIIRDRTHPIHPGGFPGLQDRWRRWSRGKAGWREETLKKISCWSFDVRLDWDSYYQKKKMNINYNCFAIITF